MTDVFVSYASEDRELARKLASALEAHGWSVWWDRNIKPDQTYDEVIEHELETAKSVVVLWPEDSVSSEWVKNEAATAAERGVLVPALIDTVKLPLEFRRRQTADLIGWDGDRSHAGFHALCDGIAAKVGTRPAPSADDSKAPRKARFHWKRKWAVASIVALVVVLAVALYIGVRNLPQPTQGGSAPVAGTQGGTDMERSQAPKTRETRDGRTVPSPGPVSPASQPEPQATSSGLKSGTFEFKWPGDDCWAVYRGEEKVSVGCGSGKQALQAGKYTVKPSSSGVFLPFSIVVKADSVVTADATGGVFEFKWPGRDCWAIYRGEEKVSVSCGSSKQALQAGTYAVKPTGSGVLVPFSIVVKPDAVVTADAMGGVFEFKWPGRDCWAIYRGDEKVSASCGSGKQALQAGAYTVKPSSSAVFEPFKIRVAKGETVRVP